MPLYEFKCRDCGQVFSESRPMSESGAPATCPVGHADTTRLLTVGAMVTNGAAVSPPQSGGCCGGGCCSPG